MIQTKKALRIITITILFLASVTYLVADRFLIRHVAIADVNAYSSTAIATLSSEENAPAENISLEESPTEIPEEPNNKIIFVDDWHYQSTTLSISIEKRSTGSGDNTLTYFIADVLISDATDLQKAFANDQFGRNIIAYTSDIAADHNAIFAINGDYYGFRNDGIVIQNGVIFRDEPARTGLAFYRDGSMKIYDETETNAQTLLDDGVWNTLSFGPALIIDGEVVDQLSKVIVDKNIGNHPIQGNQPRTGIGIINNNHYVFVVVDGRSIGYSRGATITEFAEIFKELGCSQAYNSDGGGSSTMYFMDRVVNNPLGKNKERGTSDILYIAGGMQ